MSRKSKVLNHGIAVIGTAVLLTVMATGCGWTNEMIFHPPQPSYGLSDVHLIRRKNCQVAVRFLPNPHARYTILYSHGNAEDLGHTMPPMRAFRDAGFSVLTYDYPDYGLSRDYNRAGATEKGAYHAATLAYEYVTSTLKSPD